MKRLGQVVRSNRGVALVITLLILVGLTLLVVGAFTTSKMGMLVSNAYSNRYRAELTAQSALEMVKETLLTQLTNDHYLILKVPLIEEENRGRFFIAQYNPDPEVEQWEYTPLFTGGKHSQSEALVFPDASIEIPEEEEEQGEEGEEEKEEEESKEEDSLASLLSFTDFSSIIAHSQVDLEAGWVYMPEEEGQPRRRFAFVVEDLQGYVNGEVAGNDDDEGKHRRREGEVVPARHLDEIALYTLFEPEPVEDLTEEDNRILEARSTDPRTLWTDSSLHYVVSEEKVEAALQNMVLGVRPYEEQQMIPYGFGYLEEGLPKYNINDLIQRDDPLTLDENEAVDAIAQAINQNLPLFDQREGGFQEDYLKTLAANMIDYADEDSDATVKEGIYRGVDAYPFISERYYRFRFVSIDHDPPDDYYAILEVTPFIELWNLCNQEVAGEIEINFETHYVFKAVVTEYSLSEDTLTDPPISFPLFLKKQVTLAPNEHQVIEFDPVTYKLGSEQVPIISVKASDSDTQSNYEMKWNGVVVDKSKGGTTTGAIELFPVDDVDNDEFSQKFRGTLPAYVQGLSGSRNTAPGDPRMAYYIDFKQTGNNYSKDSNLWGQTVRYGSVDSDGEAVDHLIKIEKWPDKGHTSTEGVNMIEIAGDEESGDLINPFDTQVIEKVLELRPEIESSKAPTRISNAGRYYSTAELGYIFDPVQWEQNPTGDDDWDVWKEIPKDADPHDGYGGGNSLRVGRGEHSKFDEEGLRASQLLDLFYAGKEEEAESLYRTIHGQVNVNTATEDALRALVAGGMRMDADVVPSFLGAPTENATEGKEADRVAQALIENRPYRSLSDVAQIEYEGEKVFGNLAQYPDQEETWEWNDAAAEEVFGRLHHASTLRSRNFRVLIVAEVVSRSGKPIARAGKVVHLFVNPIRDEETGDIIDQEIEVYYEQAF